MREYKALSVLRAGETLDLDGLKFVKEEGDIQPGDLYIAERNAGPKLLTAKRIDTDLECIFPTCTAYPYDLHECIKVKEVE